MSATDHPAGTPTGAGPISTDEMVLMHVALRREFRLAPGLMRRADRAGRRARARTADHVSWLLSVLHQHHTVEDRLLWPLLLERCPTELAPIVHLMEDQHEEIGALVDRASALLPPWRTGRDAADTELSSVLEDLVAVLDVHLRAEEEQLLPLAARWMTQEEWDLLGAEGMRAVPVPQLPRLLGMFRYEGDDDVIRQMLHPAPAVVRAVMPSLGSLVYALYALRVHGTARP